MLPLMQTTYGRLKRMLSRYIIKNVSLPLRKILQLRPSCEGRPGAEECGRIQPSLWVRSGLHRQTCRSIKTRFNEHYRHIRFGQADKLAVAQHSFNHNHHFKFQDTQILSAKSGCMNRLFREATELEFLTKQYEQGRWLYTKRVMETSHSPP